MLGLLVNIFTDFTVQNLIFWICVFLWVICKIILSKWKHKMFAGEVSKEHTDKMFLLYIIAKLIISFGFGYFLVYWGYTCSQKEYGAVQVGLAWLVIFVFNMIVFRPKTITTNEIR